MRRFAWVVLAVLSVGVAGYAATIAVMPGWGPPFVATRMAETPAMAAHVTASAWALAVGSWQFSVRLRRRALAVHQWVGRSYVATVVLGGLSAIALRPRRRPVPSPALDSACSACCGWRAPSRRSSRFAAVTSPHTAGG